MTAQELKFVLSEGEGPFVEFKEKIGKTLVRELVAFANASGGRLLLGVSDDSTPIGIRIDNRLKSQIQDIARNCDPSVIVELKTVGDVLVIEISESINKPHSCSDGFFIRIGANSQKLSRDEIFAMGIKSGRLRFDEQTCASFDLSSDVDEEKLLAYLDIAGLNTRLPTLDVLTNLDVIRKENKSFVITNAGVLLFAKKPHRFLKSDSVICAVYQGNDKAQILDRKIYNEGLLRNIEQAINYVKRHIDVRFDITSLERKEISQYPEEALREAIVNAVMHRDYFNASGDITIEVFKTQIIISNPGGLVSWLNPKDFGKYSRSRNNLIASMLMRTPYAEKMGTGILRINRALLDAGLPLAEYNFDEYNFSITLHTEHIKTGVVESKNSPKNSLKGSPISSPISSPKGSPISSPKGSPISSPKTADLILMLIKKNPEISTSGIGQKLKISKRAVIKQTNKLKEEKKLRRIGSAKGGRWEITE